MSSAQTRGALVILGGVGLIGVLGGLAAWAFLPGRKPDDVESRDPGDGDQGADVFTGGGVAGTTADYIDKVQESAGDVLGVDFDELWDQTWRGLGWGS